jgi:hypothetical protein
MATIPLPALHTAPIAAPSNPLQMYGQMLGIQNAQQEMQQRQQMAPLQQQEAQNSVQSGALQVQQQQRQQASTKALMASFANLDPSDPNYFDKGIKAAQSSGQVLPQQIQSLMNTRLDYQTKVSGLTTAQQKEKQNRADSLYSVGTQALKLPDQNLMEDWPELRSNIIDLHQGDQNFDPTSVPEQFPGRDWLQANTILQGMSAAGVRAAAAQQSAATGAEKQANEAPAQMAASEIAQTQAAAQQLAASPDQSSYTQALGELPMKIARLFPQQFNRDAVLQAGMTPSQQAQAPVAKMEMKDWLEKNPTKADGTPNGPSDYQLWTQHNSPMAMVMGNQFTPGATELAAKNLLTTGTGPQGMYRSPGTTAAVYNQAAEMNAANGGGGIAANKATYQADAASLKKLQTNFDQVEAFEGTAQKNIDLLQQTAQKIPDLGTRWANIPVRMINANMIGTDNMAAFKTALNTAQTESAKVLNSSNATGVLSDSARHELQDVIDGNVPYSALVSSLNTLKQDMGNRTQAYQKQIREIQGRLKGPQASAGGGQDGAAAQGGPARIGVGQTIMQGGHPYKVTAVDKNGKPTAAEPVK